MSSEANTPEAATIVNEFSLDKVKQLQRDWAALQTKGVGSILEKIAKAEADLEALNAELAAALAPKAETKPETGTKPKRVNMSEAEKVSRLNPVLTGEPKSLKQIAEETKMTPTQFKPVLEAQKKKLEITEDPNSTRAAGKKAKLYKLKQNQTLTVAAAKK